MQKSALTLLLMSEDLCNPPSCFSNVVQLCFFYQVEPYGYAWQAGLRQGSRLVEICKVSVATLTHEQMIDLLRTSVSVRVVIIPPHDDATPRR